MTTTLETFGLLQIGELFASDGGEWEKTGEFEAVDCETDIRYTMRSHYEVERLVAKTIAAILEQSPEDEEERQEMVRVAKKFTPLKAGMIGLLSSLYHPESRQAQLGESGD